MSIGAAYRSETKIPRMASRTRNVATGPGTSRQDQERRDAWPQAKQADHQGVAPAYDQPGQAEHGQKRDRARRSVATGEEQDHLARAQNGEVRGLAVPDRDGRPEQRISGQKPIVEAYDGQRTGPDQWHEPGASRHGPAGDRGHGQDAQRQPDHDKRLDPGERRQQECQAGQPVAWPLRGDRQAGRDPAQKGPGYGPARSRRRTRASERRARLRRRMRQRPGP